MTKADLVERVWKQIGPGLSRRDCQVVVDAFLAAVKDSLAEGEHIEIRGFGTFKVRERKSRLARNPRTGDPVEVPPRAQGPTSECVSTRAIVREGPSFNIAADVRRS